MMCVIVKRGVVAPQENRVSYDPGLHTREVLPDGPLQSRGPGHKRAPLHAVASPTPFHQNGQQEKICELC